MVRVKAHNSSYQSRSGKRYKHPFPNARMTPADRREQYARLRAVGASRQQAERMRDWYWG